MKKTHLFGILTFIIGLLSGLYGSEFFWIPLVAFPAIIFIELGIPFGIVLFLLINPGVFIIAFFSAGVYVTFLYCLAAIFLLLKVFYGHKIDGRTIFSGFFMSAVITFIITSSLSLFGIK